MHNDSKMLIAFAALVFLVGFGVGSLIGMSEGEKREQKKAVEAKVAEFYIDKNYQKQFRYKGERLDSK